MKTNEQNTEQVILEAAEAEFLEKGYDGAKMLSIARRAGVAHSMPEGRSGAFDVALLL